MIQLHLAISPPLPACLFLLLLLPLSLHSIHAFLSPSLTHHPLLLPSHLLPPFSLLLECRLSPASVSMPPSLTELSTILQGSVISRGKHFIHRRDRCHWLYNTTAKRFAATNTHRLKQGCCQISTSAAPTMCLPEKGPKHVLVTSVFETLETEIMHSVPWSSIVPVLHGRHGLGQSILDSSDGASSYS